MAKKKSLLISLLVVGSWFLLALLILVLVVNSVVTYQLGLLMLVALVGCYVGFGVLIAVYRLVVKLE
jgi:hypothetical protein